jgi:receptor protein-tyrosine kinase
MPAENQMKIARNPLNPGAVVARASHLPNRSIGAILIDAGKLLAQDAERILALQKRESLRFGDAAIKLGLVAPEDIQHALSLQFDYPYLLPGEANVSHELVAAYAPFARSVETLRALRSQLLLRWFGTAPRRKALAIVSPGRSEGRSYLAANLAIVFSQLGERTLLIDADLRRPRQHELFRLSNQQGLSSMLAGRTERDAMQRVPAFVDLSVLTAGATPPNPVELLGRPSFSQTLERLADEFDVIILDTAAGAESADAQAVAVKAGAALVIAREDHTRVREADELLTRLSAANAQLVGMVLTSF